DMLIYYAMSVLVGDGNDWKPQYDGKSYEREKRWHNIGGQLVAEADLKKLIDELSGFQSWDDIHRWMDDRWGGYEEQKRQHAYQVVLDLLLSDEISDEQWKRLTERYEEICKEMEEQAELSRAKDFDNEFRKMTFESEEERKAVIK
ncbi:MAG: DUF4954 family protein, partial [Prevotella sp.]|nr:DUF4954 family protein [Prevotella sp.]